VSYEPDDDIKEKKLVTLNSEVIPFYLEKLEDIAKDHGGYLALGRVMTKSCMNFLCFDLI
jgi:glutathione S-transferase